MMGPMAAALTSQQALRLWHHALSSSVRAEGPDLSARQMAILMQVYLDTPPHTVRGLAAGLRISKPAVVRALDTLGRLDLIRRRRDQDDKRNVLVQRTVKGSVFLSEFADIIATAAEAV